MRSAKTGLDYFPMDIDFFEDEKIEFISAKFDVIGEIVVIKLLSRIYRHGYYLPWGEDECMLFAKRAGSNIDKELVDQIIAELFKRNFLSLPIFEQYKVLTSKGIQARYFEVCKRRKPYSAFLEYMLLDCNSLPQNVNIISLNVDRNTTKESKVKESKVKESKGVYIYVDNERINEFKNTFQGRFQILVNTRQKQFSNVAYEIAADKWFDNVAERTFTDWDHVRNSFMIFWKNLSEEKTNPKQTGNGAEIKSTVSLKRVEETRRQNRELGYE